MMWDQPAIEIFRQELEAGERLLWAGRPGQGIIVRPKQWPEVFFFLLWGGFAFFWEAMVILGGAPLCMVLFGLPFVLVGFQMLFGRFLFDALRRRNSYYAVTDKRILSSRAGPFGRRLQSAGLEDMTDVKLESRPDGRGRLEFTLRDPSNWWTQGAAWSSLGRLLEGLARVGMSSEPSFEMISDAKQVHDQIKSARSDLRSR